MLNIYLTSLILHSYTLSLPRVLCELTERDHLKPMVAFKQNIQGFPFDPIKIGARSYKDLVTNCKIFIDNTLLLHDFLTNPLINLVLSPRKWGKTMNLDMIKTFLEPHINEFGIPIDPTDSFAYRFFQRGEIHHDYGIQTLAQNLQVTSHPDLVRQYQGKQPVIFISFRDAIGDSFESTKRKFGAAIKRSILHHKYLSIAVSNRTYFKRAFIYDSKTENSHATTIARIMNESNEVQNTDIAFLCEALHLHFRTKPFILIDDYDQPVHSALQHDTFNRLDSKDLISMVDRFMAAILNNNFHLQGAVITGRMQLKHNYWKEYHKRYVAEKDDPWRIYFGFSDLNGRKMYHTFSSGEVRHERMYRWYNRFKSTPDLMNYYNPWPFANFLKHDRIECYSNDSFDDNLVRTLVAESSAIRCTLLKLISKVHVFIETRIPFTANDIYEMRHSDRFFNTYLNIHGFILRHPPYDRFFGRAEISNCEAAHQMAYWLLEYFKREYNVSQEMLNRASHDLWSIVNTTSVALVYTESLQESLTALYRHCEPYLKSKLDLAADNVTRFDMEKDLINSIFFSVSLQAQILSKFDILAYYNNTRSVDIMMTNALDRYGAAFVLGYTVDAEAKALARAHQSSIMFNKYKRIKYVKFVGVSVPPTRTVTILQYAIVNNAILF